MRGEGWASDGILTRIDWARDIFKSVNRALFDDPFWRNHFPQSPRVHLAVLREPYLTLILMKRKTIESRFSITRRAPYQSVRPNDTLLLKLSSGPILGIARIDQADFYPLNPSTLSTLIQEFSHHLAVPNNFWKSQHHKRYATLVHLSNVRSLPSIPCHKPDRRAWVILPTPRSASSHPAAHTSH